MELKTAVTFDTDKLMSMSAKEIATLMEYGQQIRQAPLATIYTVANLLAKIVIACPEEWGKPDDPETYVNLPWKTHFQNVIVDMVTAINEDPKN